MARYRIPGKNFSKRSIFGITAIVVVVAAIVAAGVAVAVLPTMVDGLEGSEFVTDGGYTRPVVTAIVLGNNGQISVNANLENVFATVQYSDGSTEQVALSEMVIEGLDLSSANVSSDVVLNFGGFKQNVSFNVIPTMLSVTYIAGEGGTIDGDLEQQVIAGQDATTVRAVPSAGYEFVRWSDGYPEAERRDRSISKTTTLQAVFAKQTFTVVFFYPDGTTAREEEVQYGMNATDIPDPDEGEMRLYGYKFEGWDASYERITQDMEIHPIMVKNAIDLNFTATRDGDGELGSIQDIEAYYPIGEQTVLRLNPNNERIFLGWNITDMNGNVISIPKEVISGTGYSVSVSMYESIPVTFTAGQTGTEGRNEYTLSFFIPENAVAGTFDINIHADFAYSTSIVNFVSTGATGNIYTANLNYGTSVGTLFDAAQSAEAFPVRNGYNFVGWYYELTESGAPDILDGSEFIIMDTVLSAYWTTEFYEVDFVLDSVENISAFSGSDGFYEENGEYGIRLRVAYSDSLESALPQTVDGIDYGVYPDVVPERAGYVFVGWYVLDANGAVTDTAADRKYRVGGDTVLRARFTPATVSVTPATDGGNLYAADGTPILGTVSVPVIADFAFKVRPALGYALGDIVLEYADSSVTLYDGPSIGEDGYFAGSISSKDLSRAEAFVLRVEFVSVNHTVGVSVSGGGGIIRYSRTGASEVISGELSVDDNASQSFEVASGGSVTMVISPASLQQRISSVSVDSVNVLSAPQGEYTLILETVTSNKDIEIVFENVYYSIQFPDTSAGSGSENEGFTVEAGDVTPGTQHLQGSEVTFTVTADPGKYLSAIRVNGTFMDVYNRDEQGITAYCRIDEYEVNYMPIDDEMPGNAPAGTAAARATENDYRITEITFTVAGITQNTIISVTAEDMYYYVNLSVVDENNNSVEATLTPGGRFTVGYGEVASVSVTAPNTYYVSEIMVNGETALTPTVTTSALSYTTNEIDSDTEIVYIMEDALHTITFIVPGGVGIDYNGTPVSIDPYAGNYTFGDVVKGSTVQFRIYTLEAGYELTSISRSVSYANGQGDSVSEVIGFRVSSHTMTFNAVDNDYEVVVETAPIEYRVEIFAVEQQYVTVSVLNGSSVAGGTGGGMLELEYVAFLNGSVTVEVKLTSDYLLELSDVIVMNASGGSYTYTAGSSQNAQGWYDLSYGATVNDRSLTVYSIGSDISIYLNIRKVQNNTLVFGVSGDGRLTAERSDGGVLQTGAPVDAGETITFTATPTSGDGAGADLLGFMVNGNWVEAPEASSSGDNYVYEYTVIDGANQVYAIFGELRWAVMIDSGIIGGDVRTNPEWVSGKTVLKIRLIPDEGYRLASYTLTIGSEENSYTNWGGLPETSGGSMHVSFIPDEEYDGVVTLTALFEQLTYSVSVENDDENGTVISETGNYDSVAYGSEVHLKISANEGYYISSITVNGLTYGSANLSDPQYDDEMRQYTSGTLILSVTVDTAVEISYRPGVYTLYVIDNPGGTTYVAAGPQGSGSAYSDVDSLNFSGTDDISLRLEAEEGYHIEYLLINGEAYEEWLASAAGIEDEVRQLILMLESGNDLRGTGNVEIEVRYSVNTYALDLNAVNTSPNFAAYDDDPVDFGTVGVFGEQPDASGKYADVEHGSNILLVFAPVLSKRYYIYSITINGTRLGADAVPSTGGNYLINVTDDVSVTVEYKREAYSYDLSSSFSDEMADVIRADNGANTWRGELSMAFRNPYDTSKEVVSDNGTYEYGLRYVLTSNAGAGYSVESLTVNGEEMSRYLGSGSTLMGSLSSDLDIAAVFMINYQRVIFSALDTSTEHGTLALNITGRTSEQVINLFRDSVAPGVPVLLADGGVLKVLCKNVAKRTIVLDISYGSQLTFIGIPDFDNYGESISYVSLFSGNGYVDVGAPDAGETFTLQRTVTDNTVVRIEFAIMRYEFNVTSSSGGRVVLSSNDIDDHNTVAWNSTVSINLTLDEGYELSDGSVVVYVNGVRNDAESANLLANLREYDTYSMANIRDDYVISVMPTRKHIAASFTGNYNISHGENVADSRLQIVGTSDRVFGSRYPGTVTSDGELITVDASGNYIGILYNDSVIITLIPIEGYTLSDVDVTMSTAEGSVPYKIGDFNNVSGTSGKTLTISAIKGDLIIEVEYTKKQYDFGIDIKGTNYGSFSNGTATGEDGVTSTPLQSDGTTVLHYDTLMLTFAANFGYYISSFEINGKSMAIGAGSDGDYMVTAEKNDSDLYIYIAQFEVNDSMLNNRNELTIEVEFSAQQYNLVLGYRSSASSVISAYTDYGRLTYTPSNSSTGTSLGTPLYYTLTEGYEITEVEVYDTPAWSGSAAKAIGTLTRIDALTAGNQAPGTNEYLSRTAPGSPTGQLTMRIDIGKALESEGAGTEISIIGALNIHSSNNTVYLVFSADLSRYSMDFAGAYAVTSDGSEITAVQFGTGVSGNYSNNALVYITRFEYQSGSAGTDPNNHRHGSVAETVITVAEGGSRNFRFEGIQEKVNGEWVYLSDGESGMSIDYAGNTVTISYTMESTRTFRLIFFEMFEVTLEMTPLYKFMGGNFASGDVGQLNYRTYASVSATAVYNPIMTDGSNENAILPDVAGGTETLSGTSEEAGKTVYSVRCGANFLPSGTDVNATTSASRANISFYYEKGENDAAILTNALPQTGAKISSAATYYGSDKAMQLMLSISFRTEGEAINTRGGSISGGEISSGSIVITPGSSPKFTIIPNAGYRLGAVGYLPDTGTPDSNGRRVFLDTYSMYDISAGNELTDPDLPFSVVPAESGNNFYLQLNDVTEGLVIRIEFIKQINVTRKIELLDGYVSPTFFSGFEWINSTGAVWSDSQTTVVDYGASLSMSVKEPIASNTGNTVRYRFVGYVINGVMQDNSLSRVYPASTVGNFTIADGSMNGAAIAGSGSNFSVEIVALYQPIFTIIIDNVFYDTETEAFMDPGNIAVRAYPYDTTRIIYYQNYNEVEVSSADDDTGKYLFRVSGGINGATGSSYNVWDDNRITLSWLQEGSADGFSLIGWQVYAYTGSGWEWQPIPYGRPNSNNYTFPVSALYEASYYRYLNTMNVVEGQQGEGISGGLQRYTDPESGYVYGIPEGGESLYDAYCIMLRPIYEKKNVLKIIPEIAETSAEFYVQYEDTSVRTPPVSPIITGSSGLQAGILQGKEATVSPNESSSYIFNGWLYQVRVNGEITGKMLKPTGDGYGEVTDALNRYGETVVLRYKLGSDNVLHIVMDEHYNIYARYTQMHDITVSATNISSSAFSGSLPLLNIVYKESTSADEIELVTKGVAQSALKDYKFNFENGVFNGMVKVGAKLFVSLSATGYSTEFEKVDVFNPRYDRLQDFHIFVGNEDVFATDNSDYEDYDDSDIESISALQNLQAYVAGAALDDSSYADYVTSMEAFDIEITANTTKRVRFDFVSYGEINIKNIYVTGNPDSPAGVKLPNALSKALNYEGALWLFDGAVSTTGAISDADGKVDGNIRISNVPLISGNGYDASGKPTDMDFWLRIRNNYNDSTDIILDNSDIGGIGINFGSGSGAAIGTKICNVYMYDADSSALAEYPFKEGDGSQANPFIIETYTQLSSIDRVYKGMAGLMNNIYFRLANNIVIPTSGVTTFDGRLTADCKTVDNNHLDMGFTGVLDGNSFGIFNMNISSSLDYTGLFSKIGQGGRIENLYVSGTVVAESSNYVGMVAGYMNGGSLHNVKIANGDSYDNSNMVIGRMYVGGLVGYMTGDDPANKAEISYNESGGETRQYVIDNLVVNAFRGGEYDENSKAYYGGAGGLVGAVGDNAIISGNFESTVEGSTSLDDVYISSALRNVVVTGEMAYGSLIGSIEARNAVLDDATEIANATVYGFVIEYASEVSGIMTGTAAIGGAIGFVGANAAISLINVEIEGEAEFTMDLAPADRYVPDFNLVHSWGFGALVGKNVGTISHCNVSGSGRITVIGAAVGGIAGVNFGVISECTMSARLKTNRGTEGGTRGTTAALGGIAGINWSGARIINCSVNGEFGEPKTFEGNATLEMVTTVEIYNVLDNGGMGGLFATISDRDSTNIYLGLAVGYNGAASYVSGGSYTGKIRVNRRNNDLSEGASYVGGAIGYNNSTVASTGLNTTVNICFFQYLYVDSEEVVYKTDENGKYITDENGNLIVDHVIETIDQMLYVGGIVGYNVSGASVGGTYGSDIFASYIGGGEAVSMDDLDQSSWAIGNAFMEGTKIGAVRIISTAGEVTENCQMPNDPSGSRLEDWFEMKEKQDYSEVPEWVLRDVTTVEVNWTTLWEGYMYGGNGRYVKITVG